MEMAAGQAVRDVVEDSAEALVAIQRVVNVLGERRDTYASMPSAPANGPQAIPKPGTSSDAGHRRGDGIVKIPTSSRSPHAADPRRRRRGPRHLVKGKIIELATSMLIELLTRPRGGNHGRLTTRTPPRRSWSCCGIGVAGDRSAAGRSQQEQMTFGHGARERGVRAVEITPRRSAPRSCCARRRGLPSGPGSIRSKDIDITQTVRIFGVARCAVTDRTGRKPRRRGRPWRRCRPNRLRPTPATTWSPFPARRAGDDGVPRAVLRQGNRADCGGGRPPKFCRNSDHRQKYHRDMKRQEKKTS